MDDFEQKSTAFVDWLRSSAGATVSDKISLHDLRHRGAGRGVIAAQDIHEGEVLFSIPRKAVLSAANSALSSALPQVVDDVDPWQALILAMIYEYLRGSETPWKPYFDILPAHFDTLMFWSDQELSELQASAVTEKIGKDDANVTFRENLIPLIRRHAKVFFPSDNGTSVNDHELLELAHRMGSTIMAYAFDIEPESANKNVDEEGYASEDEDEALPKGMVPLADMLNADADRNNARLHHGPGALTMEAVSDIKAGDEIFNDYGALPRSDLLRRYGYVTPNYAQYDVVEVSTQLIAEIVQAEANLADEELQEKLDYLADQDLVESGYDITGIPSEEPESAFSPEMCLLLASLVLPNKDFQRMKSKGKLPKPDMTPQMARLLEQIIAKRAAEYPTSLEQDKTLAATDVSDIRKSMALAVRIGEKEILEQAHALLQSISQGSESAKRSAPGGDSGFQKKRKTA
ncbi:uncharacterized protein K452DRAFT_286580 [Aplosporella prunicola CBS 121167]|uniref:Ribosomal lysine N-methyltransferase 4 n=1 Tax=Aplosporella prunicola CBS 121167 TaxID=1176127 RepID=A0A6A6BH78_9PEZI|nr:uncharacterized protein K452DRAFT_286580 [Aplosporella prunicola CBS 121167]KAF2142948.1 hypothetical protein K452DRAFT_286580 [Aplosporella prunicola CBS 121167]